MINFLIALKGTVLIYMHGEYAYLVKLGQLRVNITK